MDAAHESRSETHVGFPLFPSVSSLEGPETSLEAGRPSGGRRGTRTCRDKAVAGSPGLPPTRSGRAGGAGGQGRWPRRAGSGRPLQASSGPPTPPGPRGGSWLWSSLAHRPGGGTGGLPAPQEPGESRLLFSEISALEMENLPRPPGQQRGLCSASDGETGPTPQTASRTRRGRLAGAAGGRAGPGVPGPACQARCGVPLTPPSSRSQEINRDKQLQALRPGNCHPFMSRAVSSPPPPRGHPAARPRARPRRSWVVSGRRRPRTRLGRVPPAAPGGGWGGGP